MLNGWRYAPQTGQLSGEGEDQVLTGLTARVLNVLITHAPAPVSLEQFAQEAWKQTHLSEDTLAQRIAVLRKVFDDDAKAPRFIRTIRGEGYALIADLTALDTTAQDLTPDTTEDAPPRRHTPWELAALAAGMVVMIAVLVGNMALNRTPEPRAARAADIAAPRLDSPVDTLLDRANTLIALQDRESGARAIGMLEEALALAPDDHQVMTALAVALSTDATKYGGTRAVDAEALARRAVEIAPDYDSGWAALGYALDAQDRLEEAMIGYEQALQINPTNGGALASLAYLMGQRGRFHEALDLDLRALEAGRGGIYTELQIARVLRILGDDARARAFEGRALLLNPGHPVVVYGLAQAEIARGAYGAASAMLDQAPEDEQRGDIAKLRARLALLNNDTALARTWLDRAEGAAQVERLALTDPGAEQPPEPQTGHPVQALLAAEIAAAHGDSAQAVAYLNTAVSLGWRDAGLLRHSPFLAALMQSDDGEAVLARIQQQIAAQTDRLNRDESLTDRLDAVINAQP